MANNERHRSESEAWERGYKEALLDVYLFLTANDQALDIELDRFGTLVALVDQVTASSNSRLHEAA